MGIKQGNSKYIYTYLQHLCMHVFTFLIVSCTVLWQLYLTGAVYSLDGSDSLKETMQASIVPDNEVSYLHLDVHLCPFFLHRAGCFTLLK